MRLREVILRQFRPYVSEIRIPIDDFTTFVGKNDIGKSCVLEALEIFFNSGVVQLDIGDLSKTAVDSIVTIGCVFDELPEQLVLDAAAHTTLAAEYLLNADGHLEIHKRFACDGAKPSKPIVVAKARHPQAPGFSDLLQAKNAQLRQRIGDLGIDVANIDLRSNPAMRQALWQHAGDLQLADRFIELDKEDAKRVWAVLEKALPTFALFQVDRSSNDEDIEFQDPMKLAIREAIAAATVHLEAVKQIVRDYTTDVARRTVDKIREMDPTLAGGLAPDFKIEPKWDQIFKMSLTGDNEIPINKRGSGVRRLILLNFFRAEAERRQREQESNRIIYAIEEPETSQHPNNQRLIMTALLELTLQDAQVIITTHNPSVASLAPISSVRYVVQDAAGMRVDSESVAVWGTVAAELGVLPDSRIKGVVCVEGPHDVNCLGHLSRILNEANAAVPTLVNPGIAVLPLGGDNLKQWVDRQYLAGFNKPEAHLYDRDTDNPPSKQPQADQVNARGNGSFATITQKRELENYLHPDAIQEAMGVAVQFGDMDDVPMMVAEAVHALAQAQGQCGPWANVDAETRERKARYAKRRLNDEAAARMTVARLAQSDPNGELTTWLSGVGNLLV